MIANPPQIQRLLRTWKMIRQGVPESLHAEYLAALFARTLKPAISYDLFLKTYHLYFQSIPLETAKEAWGIHHNQTYFTTPQTQTFTA